MSNIKQCSRCKRMLSKKKFNLTVWGTLGSYCRICRRDYERERYLTSGKEYYRSRSEYYKKYRKKAYSKLKLEVFLHYTDGNIHCQCPSKKCSEISYEFMTIDHVDGGGWEGKKQGIGSGSGLYFWLKKNNFPLGFRVLCYNCNCVIGMNGFCPHSKTDIP